MPSKIGIPLAIDAHLGVHDAEGRVHGRGARAWRRGRKDRKAILLAPEARGLRGERDRRVRAREAKADVAQAAARRAKHNFVVGSEFDGVAEARALGVDPLRHDASRCGAAALHTDFEGRARRVHVPRLSVGHADANLTIRCDALRRDSVAARRSEKGARRPITVIVRASFARCAAMSEPREPAQLPDPVVV